MERHDAVCLVGRAHRTMTSGVADAKSIQHQPRRPDRGKCFEQRAEHRACRDRARASDARKVIEQIAGPRGIGTEQSRLLRNSAAEAAQQRAAPLQPDQRVRGPDLKVARKGRRIDPRERTRIGPQRVRAIGRECACTKHFKTRNSKPFRARERGPLVLS